MLAAQCVRREYSRSQEGARGAPLTSYVRRRQSQPVRGVLLIAQSATRRTGRDQLAYVAIDGIRLGKCLSIHFEHWQSTERRIRLAALPVGGCDAVVLERDPANRECESGWLPASAVNVEVSEFQHFDTSLAQSR